MEIALDREIRRAERHQKQVAVLMLDVDHFKQFNDTYGHEAGDTVLREVADTLRQSVPAEGVVCRFGGEEFVAILPELSMDAGLALAELLRQRVSEIRVRSRGESLREITISIGVAVYPQNAESLEELLRVADRALYEAKHQGRNRVIAAESILLA
jgi:diguanylate cyclase (GGDEF)-like protein